VLSRAEAGSAVGAVAAACTGHVGLVARHLGTGEELSWNPDATIQTASTVKVAIYAEVLRQARLGLVDTGARAVTQEQDLVGGSGVLSVLRPGLTCTVADLCTLMIVLSDNTATNMLIDLLGGVHAVNKGVAALGFPGILLDHKVGLSATGRPLATATPSTLARLMASLEAGTVVDEAASQEMLSTLRNQQDRSLFPRYFLESDTPALAHKTGCVRGFRGDIGVLYLPGDGGAVAYCAVADRLEDQTMTALAEGEQVVGKLGAIVLARWWPGPGPVPLRPGVLRPGIPS